MLSSVRLKQSASIRRGTLAIVRLVSFVLQPSKYTLLRSHALKAQILQLNFKSSSKRVVV